MVSPVTHVPAGTLRIHLNPSLEAPALIKVLPESPPVLTKYYSIRYEAVAASPGFQTVCSTVCVAYKSLEECCCKWNKLG